MHWCRLPNDPIPRSMTSIGEFGTASTLGRYKDARDEFAPELVSQVIPSPPFSCNLTTGRRVADVHVKH